MYQTSTSTSLEGDKQDRRHDYDWPQQPVPLAGAPNEHPYRASVTGLDTKGQIVTQFASDAAGQFRVVLKPGT